MSEISDTTTVDAGPPRTRIEKLMVAVLVVAIVVASIALVVSAFVH